MFRRLFFVSVAVCFAGFSRANDWPQFRGPDANGLIATDDLPLRWSESDNLAWVVDVPGSGWSAPIVTGGKVVVTTAVPAGGGGQSDVYRYEVHCYDLASGEPVWKRLAAEGKPRIGTHHDNTYASETPVTDGEHVYVYFGMTGLYCYGLDGELEWEKDLGVFPMSHDWGTASSPTLHGGLLFLQIDNEADSHVVALDAATGDERWRVERPGERSNWSTPIVWSNSKRAELVVGGRTVRSYEPATGEELWSMEIGGRSSASPSAVGDVLYVGSENRAQRGGTPGGLFAVEAGASGPIDVTADPATEAGLLWADLRGAIGMSSPLIFEGQVYILERRGGMLRVHNAATGELDYRKRMPGAAAFWSSPWAYAGRVFCLDDAGKTFVLAPGDRFELVATNDVPDRFWSTPAMSGGSLLLRSDGRLYCVRTQEGA